MVAGPLSAAAASTPRPPLVAASLGGEPASPAQAAIGHGSQLGGVLAGDDGQSLRGCFAAAAAAARVREAAAA